MDNNEFIQAVARRCWTSAEQATAITRATLRTLAERIDRGEARTLAAELPEELRAYVFAPSETVERFGLDIFVQRVSGRADVDGAQAKAGMRAVFDTMREAVTPGEYDDVVGQLPAELWEITESAARFDSPRAP
ncbi:MAG TPA: DUF2267 domain-containing protein [Micromonospora sp.]|nr:DUF2267 domain-containing protein [Micromonospora sp.]